MVARVQSPSGKSCWTFLNNRFEVAWLRKTHLRAAIERGDVPEFQSFALEGNHNAPDKVTLYASLKPLPTEQPVLVLEFQRTAVTV